MAWRTGFAISRMSSRPSSRGCRQSARTRRLHPRQQDRLRPRGDRDPGGRRSPHQVDEFRPGSTRRRPGRRARVHGRERVQAEVHSPLWLAGLSGKPSRNVLLDPAKLVRAWPGLRERGVMIHEFDRVTAVERRAGGVRSQPRAARSWRRSRGRGDLGLLRLARRSRAISCPSTTTSWFGAADARARESIGWRRRQGCPTRTPVPLLPLDRGRSDPVGRLRRDLLLGNGVGRQFDRRPATFQLLEGQFRRRFRSSPASDSRTAGRCDRHDIALHVTFGQALGGGSRMRWVTPGSASGRAAGPAASFATSSSGRTHTCFACASSRARRSPSRPSRCAMRRPAVRWSSPGRPNGAAEALVADARRTGNASTAEEQEKPAGRSRRAH